MLVSGSLSQRCSLKLLFKREIHSRNKKAMEHIARGWSALKEVDRVIDATWPDDQRLFPLLLSAKESFELALEADNSSTHARYWLAKLHLKYSLPGACKAIGAALLVEAAEMGDAQAQYHLGNQLRVENPFVRSDQQAARYLQAAVNQMHTGALYLLGVVYLTGDCVQRDAAYAMWCFQRASEKGHVGAAIACGSLILRGVPPLPVSKVKRGRRKTENEADPAELAREKFRIAAAGGCELGLKWLAHLQPSSVAAT